MSEHFSQHGHNSSMSRGNQFQKKKFSIKQLAYNYNKKADMTKVVKQLTANKGLTSKVSRTLKQASLNRVDSYLDELLLLF